LRTSIVKAKLARDEPALGTCLHLTDPSLHELVGLMGFDGIWMDMEHHGYSVQTAQGLMRAARVGKTDIIARLARGEFMRMGRILESGAQGIMYPRCNDADEAREVVRYAKFAPLGERGFDGGNPDMPYCNGSMDEYIQFANDETFIIIQIETPQALENAQAIAEVEGVDVLMLGPADFSIMSGIVGQFNHALIRNAEEKIAQAARRAGKHWARPVGSPEDAKRLLDMGARLLFTGADILMVKLGLERIQSQFSELGFTFDNQLSGGAKHYLQKS